jgi:hypothetical protein
VQGTPVTDLELMVTLRVLHPGFASMQRAQVLAGLSGADPADPDLAEHALLAAERAGWRVSARESAWITPTEAHLPDDEATLRTLVRCVGAVPTRQISPSMIPAVLRSPAVLDVARRAVVTAKAIGDNLSRRQGRPARFRAGVIDAVLSSLWGCDQRDLVSAAWDRGFADLDQLRELAGFLIGYLRVLPPPRFPSADPLPAHHASGHREHTSSRLAEVNQ